MLFGGDGVFRAIGVAFAPLLMAAAFAIPAMILFGLPITALLYKLKRETRAAYVASGTIVGVIAPILFVWVYSGDGSDGIVLSLFGGLGGAVTGSRWGGWRQQQAEGSGETAVSGEEASIGTCD